MKAIITVGCSASGKSTFAEVKQLEGYYRIERDLIREVICSSKVKEYRENQDNLYRYWKFKWEDEVTKEFNALLNRNMELRYNIIISDTNLNKDRRNLLITVLENAGYEVTIEVFGNDLNLEELWKRDTYRKNTVGHHIIAKQYKQFREEFPKYSIADTEDKPVSVIFDIDGTLALMRDRGAYEWGKVGNDEYNHLVFSALKSYANAGCTINLMSGRDEVCRQETEDWFERWFHVWDESEVPDYNLFMRPQNDMRKDSIIKLELFRTRIDGNYRVLGVFDDRPSVCRDVWYELGFKVYHCDNPYLEF